MRDVSLRLLLIVILISLIGTSRVFAAYNLEVPVESWDEFRLQFKKYSKYLLASYDRAFADDYEGAIREVDKAIELLPDEGIGFAERSKYNRIINNAVPAENDFKTAIKLFDKAIEQYGPKANSKAKKKIARKTNQADAGRLVATLRYQRGEAYFNFEQYRQASADFAAACQGGNSAACSRIWDAKAVEKRGVHWVPLSSRQYYDRQRVERISPAVVRVWLRREEFQPLQTESGPDSYIQQHLELNCSSREFRIIETITIASGNQQVSEEVTGSAFMKPVAGSASSRLMISLCPRRQSK